MNRKVGYSPEALDDLRDLYDYIADRGATNAALLGFERRTAIAFHVTPDTIVIDRILHGGQNVDAAFTD